MTGQRHAIMVALASACLIIGTVPGFAQVKLGPLVSGGQVQVDPNIINRLSGRLPASMNGKGCTFYEHANGGGERWHKSVGWLARRYDNQDSYAEYVNTVGDWWNDRISSLSCDDSARVRCSIAVYPEVNKGGREAIFWGSQGLINLADFGYDDTISSYMIFCNLMK